MEFAMWK